MKGQFEAKQSSPGASDWLSKHSSAFCRRSAMDRAPECHRFSPSQPSAMFHPRLLCRDRSLLSENVRPAATLSQQTPTSLWHTSPSSSALLSSLHPSFFIPSAPLSSFRPSFSYLLFPALISPFLSLHLLCQLSFPRPSFFIPYPLSSFRPSLFISPVPLLVSVPPSYLFYPALVLPSLFLHLLCHVPPSSSPRPRSRPSVPLSLSSWPRLCPTQPGAARLGPVRRDGAVR